MKPKQGFNYWMFRSVFQEWSEQDLPSVLAAGIHSEWGFFFYFLFWGYFVVVLRIFLLLLLGMLWTEKKASKLPLFPKEHIILGNHLPLFTYLSCLMQWQSLLVRSPLRQRCVAGMDGVSREPAEFLQDYLPYKYIPRHSDTYRKIYSYTYSCNDQPHQQAFLVWGLTFKCAWGQHGCTNFRLLGLCQVWRGWPGVYVTCRVSPLWGWHGGSSWLNTAWKDFMYRTPGKPLPEQGMWLVVSSVEESQEDVRTAREGEGASSWNDLDDDSRLFVKEFQVLLLCFA